MTERYDAAWQASDWLEHSIGHNHNTFCRDDESCLKARLLAAHLSGMARAADIVDGSEALCGRYPDLSPSTAEGIARDIRKEALNT